MCEPPSPLAERSFSLMWTHPFPLHFLNGMFFGGWRGWPNDMGTSGGLGFADAFG